MKLEKAASQLEALGNPTRLNIYRMLVRAGDDGLPVGRSRRSSTSRPRRCRITCKRLVDAGLVTQERQATTLICRANYPEHECADRLSRRRMLRRCRLRSGDPRRSGRRHEPLFCLDNSKFLEGWKHDPMTSIAELPVAVIGAGPVGLAAAAHLVQRGIAPADLRARRERRRVAARMGACAGVLALALQHRRRGAGPARQRRAGRRPTPTAADWRRDRRATICSRSPRCRRSPANLKLGATVTGDHPRGPRQGVLDEDRDSTPFVVRYIDRDGDEHRDRGTRGDRCLRHLDAAQPDGRRRAAGARRARCGDRIAYGIPDVVGPSAQRLCRQAHAGGRQRPFGDQRRAGADGAAGGSAADRDLLGAAAQQRSTGCSAAG